MVAPRRPRHTGRVEVDWSKVGAIAAGGLRLVVVAAAVAVPTRLLWQEREVAFGGTDVAASESDREPGWAAVLLGGPSGAPARPLPLPPVAGDVDDAGAPGRSDGPDRNDPGDAGAAGSAPAPGSRGSATSRDGASAAVGDHGSNHHATGPHTTGPHATGRGGSAPFLPALREEQRDRQGTPPTPSGTAPLPPRVPDDFELTVAPNTTLGEIAQVYYGTARPSLVRALATYNGLADPNKLRSGQTLFVPDRSRLGLD